MPKYHGRQSFRRSSRRTPKRQRETPHVKDGAGQYIELNRRKEKPYFELALSRQITIKNMVDAEEKAKVAYKAARDYVSNSFLTVTDNPTFLLLFLMVFRSEVRKRISPVGEIAKYYRKHPGC